jgi:hypothetical protein
VTIVFDSLAVRAIVSLNDSDQVLSLFPAPFLGLYGTTIQSHLLPPNLIFSIRLSKLWALVREANVAQSNGFKAFFVCLSVSKIILAAEIAFCSSSDRTENDILHQRLR